MSVPLPVLPERDAPASDTAATPARPGDGSARATLAAVLVILGGLGIGGWGAPLVSVPFGIAAAVAVQHWHDARARAVRAAADRP